MNSDRSRLMVESTSENVSVGSTIGGSQPSRWLLKTGGELTGNTNFASLDVHGSIEVGKNLIKAKEKWTICYPRL